MKDYVISCVLDDIPDQIDEVTWPPASGRADEYILNDGKMSSNSQTSTLTITESKLKALKELSSGIHTFRCSFIVGTTRVAVTATQTITVFHPSNISMLFNNSN